MHVRNGLFRVLHAMISRSILAQQSTDAILLLLERQSTSFIGFPTTANMKSVDDNYQPITLVHEVPLEAANPNLLLLAL